MFQCCINHLGYDAPLLGWSMNDISLVIQVYWRVHTCRMVDSTSSLYHIVVLAKWYISKISCWDQARALFNIIVYRCVCRESHQRMSHAVFKQELCMLSTISMNMEVVNIEDITHGSSTQRWEIAQHSSLPNLLFNEILLGSQTYNSIMTFMSWNDLMRLLVWNNSKHDIVH